MSFEIWIGALAWSSSAVVVLLMLIVVIEVIAALVASLNKKSVRIGIQSPATVVLVPANNEEALIGSCLDTLSAGLPSNTRILVVAHNCTDGTARVARSRGVDVTVLLDDGRGGKPKALEHGLQTLDAAPPDVVVIVDADCLIEGKAVSALSEAAWRLQRPTMGAYSFAAPSGASGIAELSSLATLLKNVIRQMGLHSLGLPCLLNGSGAAFPFRVIRLARHGHGSIAEDYQLTIDLIRLGYPTAFCEQAKIDGQLPSRALVALAQRKRWEHGHLSLTIGVVPRLFLEGLFLRDLNRIALALDLAVPPLALLLLAWIIASALSVWFAMSRGSIAPLIVLIAVGMIFGISILMAWIWFAGAARTLTAVASVPRYLFWKIPLYSAFVWNRETKWAKTKRD